MGERGTPGWTSAGEAMAHSKGEQGAKGTGTRIGQECVVRRMLWPSEITVSSPWRSVRQMLA